MTASITNGILSSAKSYTDSATTGLVTASITNGILTSAKSYSDSLTNNCLTNILAGSQISVARTGQVITVTSTLSTNGLVGSWVTNGILAAAESYSDGVATNLYPRNNPSNYVTATVTNGILASAKSYTDSATTGLVTASITNGILSSAKSYTDSATTGLASASITNNCITNILAGSQISVTRTGQVLTVTSTLSTNGLVGSWVTNGILASSKSYTDSATTGLVTASITNGILSAAKSYTDSATTGLASASITNNCITNILAGANVSIAQTGQTVTVSATSAGTGVVSQTSFTALSNATALVGQNFPWSNSVTMGANYDSTESMTVCGTNLYAACANNSSVSNYASVWMFNGSTWSCLTNFAGYYTTEYVAAWRGQVYAGTGDQAGMASLFKHNPVTMSWALVTNFPSAYQSIRSLVDYNDLFWIGMQTVATVYSYDGANVSSNYTFAGYSQVKALKKYNGFLYAALAGSPSAIYRYDGSAWTLSSTFTNTNIRSLETVNGYLYAGMGEGSYGLADLWHTDGATWYHDWNFGGSYQRVESLCGYRNALRCGLYNPGGTADVYTWDGTNAVLNNSFATGTQVETMHEYNDRWYLGLGRASAAAVWASSIRSDSRNNDGYTTLSPGSSAQNFTKPLTVLGSPVLTNGTTNVVALWYSGSLSGSNGVFYTQQTTNWWILHP